MTSSDFDNREKAFENKFKAEEEFNFRVHARAVKLFGLWVAEQLGMGGDHADAYALALIDVDLQEPGHHDFMNKVKADFTEKKVEFTEHHLENQFKLAIEEAQRQLQR